MGYTITHEQLAALHSALETCRAEYPHLTLILRMEISGIVIASKQFSDIDLGVNLFSTSDWIGPLRANCKLVSSAVAARLNVDTLRHT